MEFLLTYLFDGAIFALVLAAFLLSKEPKQTAILVCVYVSLFAFLINATLPVEYIYSSLAILEAVGAAFLISFMHRVDEANRRFYAVMAAFLTVSVAFNCILIPLYKYANIGTFSIYTYCYQGTAIAHVLTMLAFSDVIGSSIRNLRDTFSSWGWNVRSQ